MPLFVQSEQPAGIANTGAVVLAQSNGVIDLSTSFLDSSGTNSSLKLVYDSDGNFSFVLVTAAGTATRYSADLAAGQGDVITDDAYPSLRSVAGIVMPPPINPTHFPSGEPGSSPGTGTDAVEPPPGILISLRSALDGEHSPTNPASDSIAAAGVQPVDNVTARRISISPVERLRLEQGVWDRAWAFEMAGFAAPGGAGGQNGRVEPYFESAFHEFPKVDQPQWFDALPPSDQALSARRSGETPWQHDLSLATDRPETNAQRTPAAELAEDNYPALDHSAFDEALAGFDQDHDGGSDPTWWGVPLHHHRELGAMALAVVIARQAWLHASPAESDEAQRPAETPRRRR